MESLYLIIPLIIIFLLIIPIPVKLKLAYNPFKNHGTNVLTVFHFKVQNFNFMVKANSVYIYSENKRKELEYSYNGPEMRFYNQMGKQIKNKIKLTKLEFNSLIGVGDAYQTALLNGVVQAVVCSVFGRFKNEKPTSSIVINCMPAYNQMQCQFAFGFKLSISLFDVVYSYIMSVIITRRNEKYLT